jgi:nitrite reductase/ring-hydroxylating ferredoxin subunit
MSEHSSCQFRRVAQAGDIPADQGYRVTAGHHDIAVFRIDGQFCAIDDICTHGFASLSQGFV